jgi:hypothetical protein
VRVAAFARLTKATWAGIEAEAQRVARVRDNEEAVVVKGESRR